MIKFYDVNIENFRETTQEDWDRLMANMQKKTKELEQRTRQMPKTNNIILASPADIQAWKLISETAIAEGWITPGQFNWPKIILSLINTMEKNKCPIG